MNIQTLGNPPIIACLTVVLLQACGGGGGDSTSNSGSTSSSGTSSSSGTTSSSGGTSSGGTSSSGGGSSSGSISGCSTSTSTGTGVFAAAKAACAEMSGITCVEPTSSQMSNDQALTVLNGTHPTIKELQLCTYGYQYHSIQTLSATQVPQLISGSTDYSSAEKAIVLAANSLRVDQTTYSYDATNSQGWWNPEYQGESAKLIDCRRNRPRQTIWWDDVGHIFLANGMSASFEINKIGGAIYGSRAGVLSLSGSGANGTISIWAERQ